jgi:alkyl hydroperoxide reductase subunit AhpF
LDVSGDALTSHFDFHLVRSSGMIGAMYDVLIVGLGCAGYTAAIYSARYKLKSFLVGGEAGGMGNTAAEVGNWPGEIEIKGPDLMAKIVKGVPRNPTSSHPTMETTSLVKLLIYLEYAPNQYREQQE